MRHGVLEHMKTVSGLEGAWHDSIFRRIWYQMRAFIYCGFTQAQSWLNRLQGWNSGFHENIKKCWLQQTI